MFVTQRTTLNALILGAALSATLSAAILALASTEAFATARAPSVQAKDAWVRWLPGSLPAAGYLILMNTGDKAIVLVGAATADYGSAMVHETRNQNGVSAMGNVAKLSIPAGGTVAFSPGGYHLMLMQPSRDLRPGDVVPITLQFEGGDELTVSFEVRNANGSRAERTQGSSP